jgi:hypothetical protein
VEKTKDSIVTVTSGIVLKNGHGHYMTGRESWSADLINAKVFKSTNVEWPINVGQYSKHAIRHTVEDSIEIVGMIRS